MAHTLRPIHGALLAVALLLGCSDDANEGGCEDQNVFTDESCLDAGTCPACGPVCEAAGGTDLGGGPACIEEVGFGMFCACECQFCVDGDSG